MRDPIHEEIHKYRAEHARKFNFDLSAICEDLKEQSRNLKTIRLPPKRVNRVRPNPVRHEACMVIYGGRIS